MNDEDVKLDGGVLDRYLIDEYNPELTYSEKMDQNEDSGLVKIEYDKRSQDWNRHKKWKELEAVRAKDHKKFRQNIREADRQRFVGLDITDPVKYEKFDTVIVNNRGVVARKMISEALRKGYRVICLYTEVDEGADYLSPETYKDVVKRNAKDLGLDPDVYEDAYKKRFVSVEIQSHTIKFGGKNVERDSEGKVDIENTLGKNPYAKVLDEAIQKGSEEFNDILRSDGIEVRGCGFFPGYGYDAENPDMPAFFDAYNKHENKTSAYKIHWIGPNEMVMKMMGDKASALKAAKAAGVHAAESTEPFPKKDRAEAIEKLFEFAKTQGAIRIKCTNTGGGRGQETLEFNKADIDNDEKVRQFKVELAMAFDSAVKVGENFGGVTRVFAETFIKNAQHIEAQVLSDKEGNVKILGLRDCSIQFDNQKFAERAITREMLPPNVYDTIVTKCATFVQHLRDDEKTPYQGAGTIEFLLDENGEFYFMEMNTRLQVEHGVTEIQTDDKIFGDMLDIAQDKDMWKKEVNNSPETVVVQSRINACELRLNDDHVNAIFSSGVLEDVVLPYGEGISVQAGMDKGDRQTTLADSMIFIITAEGFDERDATRRMVEALNKTKICGFPTNLNILRKYYKHRHEELENAYKEKRKPERETVTWFAEHARDYTKDKFSESCTDEYTAVEKVATYIANVSVNGAEGKVPFREGGSEISNKIHQLPPEVLDVLKKAHEGVVRKKIDIKKDYPLAADYKPTLGEDKLRGIISGLLKDKGEDGALSFNEVFDKYGADVLMWEIVPEMDLLFTDTTTRDGPQSNFATRLRGVDAKYIQSFIDGVSNLFSAEVGGGATADVNLQFLFEDPIANMEQFNAILQRTPSQILWRGQNTVGYGPSHEFMVELFLQMYAMAGVKVFRIFDSQNDLDSMTSSIKAVREMGLVAEGTICYAGGLNDETQEEYKTDYYVNLAKQLVDAGAHCICIKDMAGLMTPSEAEGLFKKLSDNLNVPVHFHTHDTLKTGVSAAVRAAKNGASVVDVAIGRISSGLAQPNLEEIIYQLAACEVAGTDPEDKKILVLIIGQIYELEQEISKLRATIFSKVQAGESPDNMETDKEIGKERIKLFCEMIQGQRNSLAGLLEKYPIAFDVDENTMAIVRKLEGILADVREKYNPWDSKIDFEAHVMESYIPGGMVSNFDDQIKSRHLGHMRKEIIMVYVLMRKWWGNPPLVTPSSKYVGDQSVSCVEKYIADHGEKGFVELMGKGLKNITPNDLFGRDGEYLDNPTLEFFAGSLGKHPNPYGINPEFKQLVEAMSAQKNVFKFTKPVGYYQEVKTEEKLTKNLKKLARFSPHTVNRFVEALNGKLGTPLSGLDDLASRIDRPSEKEISESADGKDNIERIQAEHILDALIFVYDKSLEIAEAQKGIRDGVSEALDSKGLDLAVRDFVFGLTLNKGYDLYKSGISNYGPLLSRLPTEVFTVGLKPEESVVINENGKDVVIKITEISKSYDSFKRRVKMEIGNTTVYREVIDAKRQKLYAKGFRKAVSSFYGEAGTDFDLSCDGGYVTAPVRGSFDNKPIGPGSIVKEGDVIMSISVNKKNVDVLVPKGTGMSQVVAVPAQEWDYVRPKDCLLTLRRLSEEGETVPCFPFSVKKAASSKNDIVVPSGVKEVIILSSKRLDRYNKDQPMGFWILENGEKRPIEAPYNCQIDLLYGDGVSTDAPQKIKPGMVAFTIKDAVEL